MSQPAPPRPRLAPAPPKVNDAVIYDLGRGSSRVILYGRGSAILLKNGVALELSDAEMQRLEAAIVKHRRHRLAEEDAA